MKQERLLAVAVTRTEQAIPGLIKDREREHAVQPIQASSSPRSCRLQAALRYRNANETARPIFKFGANLEVVVNLAVVGDRELPSFVFHGLCAGIRQIQNRKTAVT